MNTKTMMESLTNESLKKLSLEELSTLYKENLNPQYLATSYCLIFRLVKKMKSKYYSLDDEDIECNSLIILDKCLQQFKAEKNVKFFSFFYQCLNNKMYDELKKQTKYEESIAVRIDGENNEESSFHNTIGERDSYLFLDLEEFEKSLNGKLKQFYNLKKLGYKHGEIEAKMNKTRPTIANYNKLLRREFINWQNGIATI